MERVSEEKKPRTFTDSMRILFKGVLQQASVILNALGLTPNALTALGLIGNLAAAFLLATGHISWGGIVALIMAPFDALDGAVARYQGRVSPFGAFLDSVTDRYSEIVLLGGLLVFYTNQSNGLAVGLIFAAITGSLMVSYVKARAEAVGYHASVGLLTRLERLLILIPALIFNRPLIALWIIAIFAHATAIQRMIFVYGQAHRNQQK